MNDYSNKINKFLHSRLTFSNNQQKLVLKPEQLLACCRFDVSIKYLYLKYKYLGINLNWPKQMYTEHIRAFSNGTFEEGDFSKKDTIEKYLDTFEVIASSIKQSGFDEGKSILPLSNEKVIIDGAHRLAACLYYKSPVTCLLFEEESPRYDFHYFKSRGMKSEFLDITALEYTRLNKYAYILTIFPVASGRENDIDLIMGRYGKVYYKKDIYFNENGALNFIRQLYYGEDWAGDFKKGFPGERYKASQCFRKNAPLKAYFFETDTLRKVQECKKEIRNLFDCGNDAAHATDQYDETVRIAEQLLNDNSIHFLNYSTYTYSRKLEDLLSIYKKWISENLYDKDYFCIDASAVLNIYGIREAKDLDFLHFGYENLSTGNSMISSHASQQVYYKDSLEEIIFNPQNYFYYNGLKYVSVKQLIEMKARRSEIKDKRDVILIKRKLEKRLTLKHVLFNTYYKILEEFQYFPANLKNLALRMLPRKLLPYLKAAYNMLKTIINGIYSFFESFGSYEKTRKYRGFTLAYSRGYSLISRIIGDKIYEAKLSQRIIEELKRTGSEYFLDVGANIGLISLNVLREIPDAKIFCFEPGPHQSELLDKTINLNNLDKNIRLFKFALGDKTGEFQFATHRSLHTSGDGFFDTQRAGKCKFIKVRMDTLDSWWKSSGSYPIKVIKIDTEGAELWVLRGGRELIKQCRPMIILEINKQNLKPYPYREQDILEWFMEMQYNVRTLNGILITQNNLNFNLNETDSYIASPN